MEMAAAHGGAAGAVTRLGARAGHAEGKISAFETMIARDWERFWRYAHRLCGNADDAEDLLSESLIDAFRAFDQYRGDGFDRWMFRILTRNRIDMARRARVRRAESLDSALCDENGGAREREIADERANPERRVLDPILGEDLQRALDALPEDFRVALLLCDVEQMEYHDIAETLRLPIGTVRSRIHRARTQMRRALESWGRSG